MDNQQHRQGFIYLNPFNQTNPNQPRPPDV